MSLTAFERWGRNRLAEIVGRLFPLEKTDVETVRQAWANGKIKKLLFIRPHQGLGDLLLATPVLSAIKASRPETRLHFLATPHNGAAVIGNTRLERIWTWDKKKAKSPGHLMSFVRRLRAEHYDLAIIISSHTPSFTSFLLARASGAKIVWAFGTEPHYDGANWSQWLASVAIPNPPADAPESAKFMDILKPLGIEGGYEPEFQVTPDVQQWADEYWRKYKFPSDRPVVAFFLGGNPDRPDRLWPAAAWARLARMLVDKAQVSILAVVPPKKLVTGTGRAEPGIYGEFSKWFGESVPVFDEAGLKQAAAILSHVNLFVCPDGGLMHVAIAARVPTVGLYFSTDPSRWVAPVPWAVGVRSPNGQPAGLSAESVYAIVEERLKLLATP